MGINTEPNRDFNEAKAVNGLVAQSKKPYLIVCTSPATGHFTPILRIVARLIQKGYQATFIAGEEFQAQVEAIGAECVPTPAMLTPDIIAEREKIPEGIPRLQFDLKALFVGQTPGRWETLKKTLLKVRKQHPDDEVVILTESFYLGHLPLLQGAALPEGFTKRPGIVNLHAATYIVDSIDTAPFGPGLPPDYTEEGRAANKAAKEASAEPVWGEILAYEREINASLGIKNDPGAHLLPFEKWVTLPDITLQLCPKSLEYERCDFHPKVKFVGALPRLPVKAGITYPSWWDDVTRGDKKIVTVTQGTVVLDYRNLVIPTLEALAERDDILTVAVLGAKGASLPADFKVPSNARVVDYFPYDAILEHTDVFVMNAGYGGFIHGVTNGVPMVLGGGTEDKPEVSARGEFAGVAVNLRTGAPSKEQVADAVSKVFADSKFKERVMEIKKENEELDALSSIEQHIEQFASHWA